MDLTIWWALFFMFLGGAAVELAEIKAWNRYKTGKREGESTDPSTRRKGG